MKPKINIKQRKILTLMIIAVVVVGCAFLIVKITSTQKRINELEARKERLETLLESETLRQEELDNKEVYVQTQKYIEERAKAIGYVYPDEIIFRKGD